MASRGGLASQNDGSLLARLVECTKAFWLFGLTTFGGPSANIVYLRRMFVSKKKWIDEKTFQDCFGIASALPGPAFSQLTFTVALLRGGILCGVWSFVLGTFPGSIAMIALGYGVKNIPPDLPEAVLSLFTGLNSAAVGLIALAAYQLSHKAVTDHLSAIMLFVSAAAATCYQSEWLFPVLMFSAGLITYIVDESEYHLAQYRARRERHQPSQSPEPDVPTLRSHPAVEEIALTPIQPALLAGSEQDDNKGINLPSETSIRSRLVGERSSIRDEVDEEVAIEPKTYGLGVKAGVAALIAFVVAFVVLLGIRAVLPGNRAYNFFCNCMLVGTIIFGGGPVVIPLLRGYTVAPGYVTSTQFLFGFALLQALPGPFFNFAAFLGILVVADNPPLGAFLGLVGIFSPGLIVQLAVLPIYGHLREKRATRSILRGIIAAAVGLVYAATWRLFNAGVVRNVVQGHSASTSLATDGWWVVLAALSFAMCDERFKVQPPFAIIAGAVGGVLKWAVTR
ncbi:hypothetical protein JAAARDRAFT_72469 [Jaapia argillacea MUCL 33604]|uniref:Chromate ion transporter n=1 Tax=Jaapia argillacea MUCL 33604 TaxID=933084 RepID=A0A067PQC5_9AGAM|nr:hypothetical protein JAAARDRAFT_72469 [Jaapia argillacea MUCL 33604]